MHFLQARQALQSWQDTLPEGEVKDGVRGQKEVLKNTKSPTCSFPECLAELASSSKLVKVWGADEFAERMVSCTTEVSPEQFATLVGHLEAWGMERCKNKLREQRR